MLKLLLAEDDPIIRDLMIRRLRRQAIDPLVAKDGQEAIELAESEQPSIILMDMKMPNVDGWEATRIIKANPTTQHIPIIALTSQAMADDRRKCMEAGCSDYMTKPVNFPNLLYKINGLTAGLSML